MTFGSSDCSFRTLTRRQMKIRVSNCQSSQLAFLASGFGGNDVDVHDAWLVDFPR